MTLSDIKELCLKKMKIFPIEMFYADPSQPGHIEELNRAGVPCMPANNDILRGINLHYELIKSCRYKILDNSSPHTEDEYNTYHWPEPKDMKPDENEKEEKPVDQSNHCLDSERYLSIMTWNVFEKRKPIITTEKRKVIENPIDIVRRIRKNSTNNQTENWSQGGV